MTFSIVIPCYNVERYLKECLDSVIAAARELLSTRDPQPTALGPQPAVEIICVDDGSTDGTGKLLDEYADSPLFNFNFQLQQIPSTANRQPALRIIHQPNGGEGAARNAALNVAAGDWVLFLDSDDVLASECLSDVAKLIREHPSADLIRFRLVPFKDGERPVWGGTDTIGGIDISKEISMSIMSFGVTEMAYRRSLLPDIRFTKLKLGADLVFTRSVFAVASRIVTLDKTLYGYRQVAASMSHRRRNQPLMTDYIDYHVKIFDAFEESGKCIDRTMARVQLNSLLEGVPQMLSFRLWSGEWQSVWRHWLEAVGRLMALPYFTRWQYAVGKVLIITRSRALALLLCALPNNLKRLGLHR